MCALSCYVLLAVAWNAWVCGLLWILNVLPLSISLLYLVCVDVDVCACHAHGRSLVAN